MSRTIEKCRVVYLKCRNPSGGSSLPKTVSRGMSIDNGECIVSLCIPNPCWISTETKISRTKLITYETEYVEDDVIVHEYVDGVEKELYIYPKTVWSKVENLYIKPLSEGKPVEEHLLLIGAPGTGKSVLAKLVARMIGIHYTTLRVTEVRSKWYGESERNLEMKLHSCLENEPTILIIDDAEYLLSTRSFVDEDKSSTELGLRNIMFNFLEKVIEEKRRLLVIATTNVSPSAIDEAYIRGGRFGEPIFINLPSYNALYRYALFKLRDRKKAEDLALKCVSRGLTISDLKTMIKYLEHGVEPDFKRISGRGYSRIYSIPVSEIIENNNLKNKINTLFSLDKDQGSTMYMKTVVDIGIPILAQILMALKKPGLLLTDPRYVDEYVYAVETQKSVAVVPTTLSNIHEYVRMNTRQPIIFVGKNPPNVETYVNFLNLNEIVMILDNKISTLIKAIGVYYNIQYSNEDLKKADRIWRSSKYNAEDFLALIHNTGRINDEILGRLVVK